MKQANVGNPVIFVDAHGLQHNALVTAAWSESCVNLIYISPNEDRKDTYGRQTERQTSVVYKDRTPAYGNYFMFPGDEPNPLVQPESV